VSQTTTPTVVLAAIAENGEPTTKVTHLRMRMPHSMGELTSRGVTGIRALSGHDGGP
jgi:hypothetical protein